MDSPSLLARGVLSAGVLGLGVIMVWNSGLLSTLSASIGIRRLDSRTAVGKRANPERLELVRPSSQRATAPTRYVLFGSCGSCSAEGPSLLSELREPIGIAIVIMDARPTESELAGWSLSPSIAVYVDKHRQAFPDEVYESIPAVLTLTGRGTLERLEPVGLLLEAYK